MVAFFVGRNKLFPLSLPCRVAVGNRPIGEVLDGNLAGLDEVRPVPSRVGRVDLVTWRDHVVPIRKAVQS
jgi:hypothetical protein